MKQSLARAGKAQSRTVIPFQRDLIKIWDESASVENLSSGQVDVQLLVGRWGSSNSWGLGRLSQKWLGMEQLG